MPHILLIQPAHAADHTAALAAQLSTPGGWRVTSCTENALNRANGPDLNEPDLIALELGLATAERATLLKDLTAARGRKPVLVTAQPDAKADDLANAVAHGAAGLAVCDGHSRRVLEGAARVLGDLADASARLSLLDTMTRSQSVFEIENDPDLIPALVQRLQRSAALFGLADAGEQSHFGVAIEEALSNALYHGNLGLDSKLRENGIEDYYALAAERRGQAPYGERTIRITETLTPDEARITIRDQGPGFDTAKLTGQATDPSDEASTPLIPSGRGYLLMQAFTDAVIYNDAGNEVTLVKQLRNAGSPAASSGQAA